MIVQAGEPVVVVFVVVCYEAVSLVAAVNFGVVSVVVYALFEDTCDED